MKKIAATFLFSMLTIVGVAQTKYKIKAKIKGFEENKTIYLAHYLGKEQYIKVDSAKVEKGEIKMEGDDSIKGGIYLLVLSPSRFYDFLMSGDQNEIEITADTVDVLKTIKFRGSPENEVLYDYRRFLKAKSDEVAKLNPNPKEPAELEAAKLKMADLQKEVTTKMDDIIKENSNTFVAKIIKANMEINVPTAIPVLPNGKKDSTFQFRYYKNHYFDHLDFTDERMVYTPFLQSKINQFYKDLVYQMPDSVISDSDKILSKVKKNQTVYRYVLWLIANKYENSPIIGMENVYVHLAQNYYLKDATWIDSTTRAKIFQRVKTLTPILVGKIMPNMTLTDTLGNIKNLSDIKAKYTIVYFYSHECGHCKDHAPELVKFYNENKAKGIEVVAIDSYPNTKLEDLKKFIREYKTEKMINWWDKYSMYNFNNSFDVFSTPTSYVLDKDKRIIGKRLAAEEFGKFIEFHEKRNGIKQ